MADISRDLSISSADSDEIDLRAVLAAVWRGKLILAICFLIAVFLGGYYAYVMASPTYRSTAVVMLNNREAQVVDFESVLGGIGTDYTVYNTELEILRSRSLMGKVVDALSLGDDPEFGPSESTPTRFGALKSTLKDQIKQLLGVERAPIVRSEAAATLRGREATINRLLSVLSVRNVPQSLVFQVTVETSDPEKSARIADTIVDLYILNQLEVKFEATQQATSWLTERVAELQVTLEAAESKVKQFRSEIDLVSTEALQGAEVQLKETRDRIEDLRIQRDALNARSAALQSAGTRAEKAQATGDTQLQQLLPRVSQDSIAEAFDRRYDQVEARLRLELQRIAAQLGALQQSQGALQDQISRQSTDLIQLQQLTREAEASRLLYEYFLGRLKETSAQQGIQQADSRVISRAVVPVFASAPRKSLILAISGMMGILAGLCLIVLRELRQNAFRSSEELEAVTGRPVIGQVPIMPGRRRRDVLGYLSKKPSSASAEAIRNLRTSIMLSNVDNPPKVLMTCSAIPGEGKTTVALSLALNFVALGGRVLVIEGDVRRRVFEQYLTNKTKDGMVSVLAGAIGIEEAIQTESSLGADILLGGDTKSNAADLFSSQKFADLVAYARDNYDHVIIDTPPVLLVPDARIIAQQVDSIVHVVKWDSTPRDQVVAALREFDSVGTPVSGLVLNQLNPRRARRYGYGAQYGAYYGAGSKYYIN